MDCSSHEAVEELHFWPTVEESVPDGSKVASPSEEAVPGGCDELGSATAVVNIEFS